MNNLVHNIGNPALIVAEVEKGPNAALFERTYGLNVFSQPTAQVFQLIVQSIAAWEHSPEVSPFSSKYDAYLQHRATFTAQELTGLQIFTGTLNGRQGGPPSPINAQCSSCHVLSPQAGAGPDLFTDSHYRNVGTPKNPHNPYYTNTNEATNPVGYNPLGENYVDLGLADFLYADEGNVATDPLHIKGVFKTPTLRNVDTRPTPAFVKDYGHNGYFKSLAQVVHFYNTRNLTTVTGEVIDFTKASPYLGLKGKPLWPAPEYIGNMQNPTGSGKGPGSHIGNLGLTPAQEADLVAFLQTLSDGFFNPQGPPPGP
jgi:cytochrome c peroxidase